MASEAVEKWAEVFKEMDPTASRRGDEWTKPTAKWMVHYDYKDSADAMGVQLTDLSRNGLSAAQVAVVVRVARAQGQHVRHLRCGGGRLQRGPWRQRIGQPADQRLRDSSHQEYGGH